MIMLLYKKSKTSSLMVAGKRGGTKRHFEDLIKAVGINAAHQRHPWNLLSRGGEKEPTNFSSGGTRRPSSKTLDVRSRPPGTLKDIEESDYLSKGREKGECRIPREVDFSRRQKFQTLSRVTTK